VSRVRLNLGGLATIWRPAIYFFFGGGVNHDLGGGLCPPGPSVEPPLGLQTTLLRVL